MCKMTNRKIGENTVNFTPQNAELLKNPLKKIFKFSTVHKKHVKKFKKMLDKWKQGM